MLAPIVFILLIGILVLVHELGHFLMAKKAGILIEEFAIGFPPRIWSKKIKQTIYSINLIPLGGYVRLHGEDRPLDKRSFAAKSIGSRFKVVVAGVLMNFVLAYFVLIFYFALGGTPLATNPEKYSSWITTKEQEVMILSIEENSPAQEMGLKPLDIILEANNQKIDSAESFSELTSQKVNQTIDLKIKRDKDEFRTQGLIIEQEGRGRIGVEIANYYSKVKFAWWSLPLISAIDFFNIISLIFLFFWSLILAILGKAKPIGTGVGPVGIYILTKQALSLGFIYILKLGILLSLNLAIINFIPFPGLDGGRALFLGIEKIRGQKVAPATEGLIHLIGFALLIIFVIALTVKDVLKLF